MGRETGLEPVTTGITIPTQLRCLHPAKAGKGDSCYLFNLSYTWVTQLIVNDILFKYIVHFNIKKFTI
jgi:hypothetical protein